MKQLENHVNGKVGFHLILMKDQFINENREYKEEIERLKTQLLKEEEQRIKIANKVLQLFVEKDDKQLCIENEHLEVLINLEDKLIWSDLRSLREDKETFKKYIRFLKEEHYFDRKEVPDGPLESWIYENDEDVVLIIHVRAEVASPIFFAGQGGYRLQVHVYPLGIKDGAGTHLSVKIRLLPGPFDAKLTWPFRQPYTCAVLNLKDPLKSIIKRAQYSDKRGERFSPVFQKPEVNNHKAGFGFAKHTKIEDIKKISGFLINGAIIVKVSIGKLQV